MWTQYLSPHRLLAQPTSICQEISIVSPESQALLAWTEVDFPKTHDLTELLALAARANERLAADLRETKALTPYGVELRYPGDRPDVSPAEAREAILLARKTRDAILPLLKNL